MLLLLQEQLSQWVSELLRQKVDVKFFIVIFPVSPVVSVVHTKMKEDPEVLGILCRNHWKEFIFLDV